MPTPFTLNAALDRLSAHAERWARTPIAAKRDLLSRLHRRVGDVAEEWVRVACEAKGLAFDGRLAGEEWISGPWVHLAYTEALGRTLEALACGRSPLDGQRVKAAPGGRLAIRVLPHDVFDRLLLNGFSADVWLQPGVTLEQARARAGRSLTAPDNGGVALVLGAGNITSIAPLDVLHKLYAANRVVILKPNPVSDYLLPVLEHIFGPFIEAGFVEIVNGGADVGAYLSADDRIDELHLTGGEATHDAIVFGTGDEGRRRKALGAGLSKRITSELGGVAPVIILPGDWSDADLRYQAEHVATQKLHNSGFNCIATQVVVLPDRWDRKDRFVEHLREALRQAPPRPAYYPGAADRQLQARHAHPDAELLDGDCPRTLLRVSSDSVGDAAFATEYFGPTLALTELPAASGEGFLDEAVRFANERLHGTLAANLIAHPATLRELRPRLDQTVAALRYGTIAINAWTGVAYLTSRAVWGGFPGARIDDIQSGIGFVHNALLLEQAERTVVRGPFRPAPRSLIHGEIARTPKPPWFVTNRTADVTGRCLTSFAIKPRWRALPGVIASALRG